MKKDEFIKKMPWGIIAGICAMSVFFLTAAMIILFFVLDGVAAQTNTTAGLFSEWYQTFIFVFDIIFALGLIGSVVMYVLRQKMRNEGGAIV